MKNILRKVGRDIIVYIACILVVVFVWVWVFNYLTTIKTEEKVCVFIGSYSVSFEKAEELNEDRPKYLKTVDVNAYSINDNAFTSYLTIFGYEIGDILILPESYINEERCSDYFAEISEKYMAQFENLGFYSVSNKSYGIKVHDKDSHESVIDCINFGSDDNDENYYLCFNIKSVHLSDLSDGNKLSERDGAIKVAQRLLTL